MKEKKIIIVTILVALLCLVCGFIIGKSLSKNDTLTDKKEEDNKEEIKDNDKFKLEDFEKVITTELQGLDGKDSLSELTNQDKLRMLYAIYDAKQSKLGNNQYSEITKKELEETKANSSLAKLDIEYTDILYRDNVYDYDSTDSSYLLWKYNKDTETYTVEPHSGEYRGNLIFNSKLIDVKERDNKYILSYEYLYYNTNLGSDFFALYYNFNDLAKDGIWLKANDDCENAFELYKGDTAYDTSKSYIENNYEEIRKYLKTYTYEFEIIDDKIVLTDYYAKPNK